MSAARALPRIDFPFVSDRVDEHGAAYAGSQLQTQHYVNKRTSHLNEALAEEFPELRAAQISWRSPLAADGYREYWDQAFLKCVGLVQHADQLKAFWPAGGPHWDALAVVEFDGSERSGVILGEGKSYPSELYGGGCAAKPGSASRVLIENSLGWTQQQLGVVEKTAADWSGPLYQNANRLAHLCWLRSLGVRAWLVHLLFTADPHGPTTEPEWLAALKKTDHELGLAAIRVDHAGHVFLSAGNRSELVG
jgi:hypothetical protein